MDLQDRIALVTGGAHRVGKAIALSLAQEGVRLVVHFHNAADQAQQTVQECRQFGVQAEAVAADLSQFSGVQSLFQTLDNLFPRLDILVNSAAIMEALPLLDADENAWNRSLDLNLKGSFFCLQAAAQRMLPQGGVIINISDLAALQPWPRFPIHSISKAGVEMLTRVAALSLAPKVRVNAIAPGPVLKPSGMSEARWAEICAEVPLKRSGSAQDVAGAVRYLCENDFITGETLVIDGGARYV